MSVKTEKRKDFLVNLLFVAAVLGLIYVFFKYLFWPVGPFLLSFLLAACLQRPVNWLTEKCKGKGRAGWSIALVLLSIAIILVPVILLINSFVSQVKEFAKYLTAQLADFPQFMSDLQALLLKWLSFLPDSVYSTVSEKITEAFAHAVSDFDFSSIGLTTDTVKSTVSSGVNGIYNVAKNVPSAILGIVIGIIAWILFTKDYRKVVNFIKLQLPESKKNVPSEIKKVFSKTILKMMKAYGLIMFITFCELSLGFTIMSTAGIMSNKYIYLIALAICIFDILPVAGSGGILNPWAIISIIMGNTAQGIGLFVLYIVITVVRQYIEPKIVGDSLGVNPLITLGGLYFGLKLFGFIGMFIVPISIMTVKAFNDTGRIHLWKTYETIDIDHIPPHEKKSGNNIVAKLLKGKKEKQNKK